SVVERIGPEMLGLVLIGDAIGLDRLLPLVDDKMKAHAGDAQILVATGETVGLLFADPFRQAVGLFAVIRMRLVDGEIVEMALSAEREPDGVDARRLHDPRDANLDRRAQRIVAADYVVVVHDMIGMVPRRRD